MLRDIKIKERDNLLSFNIVLLFTKSTNGGITAYMVTAEITDLTDSPHILYDGTFCYHIDGVAMG